MVDAAGDPTALIGAVLATCSGTGWATPSLRLCGNALSDMNDFPLVLGYVIGTVGWLAGLGVFNDLSRQ